jgi:hypothetical protein
MSATAATTAEQQILAQYRRYWTTAFPAAAAAPRAGRRAILQPVVTEPGLSTTLAWLMGLDGAGESVYGRAAPITQTLEEQGELVLARGCLDSSQTGKLQARSGKIITRGLRREAVLMWFKLDSDGVWRVYGSYFPKGARC